MLEIKTLREYWVEWSQKSEPGKLYHIWFKGRNNEGIVLTEKCHREEEGSENEYSSWGRRCSCSKPIPNEDELTKKYPIK